MSSEEAPRAHNSMSTAILEPTHDHEAELLLETSRARTGTTFDAREFVVEGFVAVTLAAVAIAMPCSRRATARSP